MGTYQILEGVKKLVYKGGKAILEVSEWKEQLEKGREMKDRFFAEHWQSPISFEDRPRFKGLEYYPPDPSYRFELELHEHSEKQVVRVAYTKGNEEDFLRWGEFRFKIGGKEQALQAYMSNPQEERPFPFRFRSEEMLFILFRDATSGKETYGAGRYIDLEPETDRTPEGKWILDFNQAHNPRCAYSDAYTCPFVPMENWLEVPIRAGEKNYPVKKE